MSYEEFDIVVDEVIHPHRETLPTMLFASTRSPIIPASHKPRFAGQLLRFMTGEERSQALSLEGLDLGVMPIPVVREYFRVRNQTKVACLPKEVLREYLRARLTCESPTEILE